MEGIHSFYLAPQNGSQPYTLGIKKTTAVRFELTRTMCNGLAIHRLNHSATLSRQKEIGRAHV